MSLITCFDLLTFYSLNNSVFIIHQGRAQNSMARRSANRVVPVQSNFSDLARFYGAAPVSSPKRVALQPYYANAYSRRVALRSFYVLHAPNEQVVFDAMRTFVPSTVTCEVANLYLEVAGLVSLYYELSDQIAILPSI